MKKIIVSCLCFVCLFLTACAVAAVEEENSVFIKSDVTDLSAYVERPVIVLVASNKEHAIYQMYDASLEQEKKEWKYYDYCFETKEFREINSEDTAEIKKVLGYGCMDENGRIYLLDKNRLSVYDEQFHKQDMKQLDFLTEKSPPTAKEFVCDRDFIYILDYTNAKLFVLDHDLETVYETDNVLKLYPDILGSCSAEVWQGGNSFEICRYDKEKGALVKRRDLSVKNEDPEELSGDVFLPGDDRYDFYYYDSNGFASADEVFLMGVKNKKAVKLFKLADFGIYPGDLEGVCPDGRGGFIANTYHIDTLNGVVCTLVRFDRDESQNARTKEAESDKTELKLAGMNITDEMQRLVYDFNAASDRYTVTCRDYAAQSEDMESARKALYLDVMKNGEIDILLLNQLSIQDLQEKDCLADLGGYLSESSVVSRDSFLPCVIEGLTKEDGAVYSLYPEFTIRTLVSGEEKGFADPGSYTTFLDEGRAVFTKREPIAILDDMLRYSGDRFVNTRTKETHFDEEFQELLALIKAQADAGLPDDKESEVSLLLQKKAVFGSGEIDFFYDFLFYDDLFDGAFSCSSYVHGSPVIEPWFDEVGMMASSKQKEGVYAFLDYLFSDEVYGKYFGSMRFPALQDFYDDKIKEMSAKEAYVDRFGRTIQPNALTYGVDDIDTVLEPMSEEQRERLDALLESCVYIAPMDGAYLDIIEEEAAYYFEGKKSVEEVCGNMQNRIENAVRE